MSWYIVKMDRTDKHPWYVYMIRCKRGSLYTGITKDVARRFAEHQIQGKKCAKYLKGKAPLALVYSAEVGCRREALRVEAHVKNQPKADKEMLVRKYLS